MAAYYNSCPIIQGLMRLKGLSTEDLYNLITYDIEHGVNFFDISDIYNDGESEKLLGEVLKEYPELREKMFIQTKCGIVKDRENDITYFDLSYKHIIESVNASLKRMNLKYIDSLLLHRPDIFFDAEQVARAFATLSQEGKVLSFGVSNFPHEALKYLKDHTNIPITTNQLQFGLGHLDLVREVLNLNMNNEEGTEHTGELFFYMKRYNITLQCWSPYQVGFFNGTIFNDPNYKELNDYLEVLGEKYGVSKCAIATSFLLTLGNGIQVITGSTNTKHVQESIDGMKIKLTKPEWYTLYRKSGNLLP